MQDWTFFTVTFGCKVNQYETEAIREAWARAGGREVDGIPGAAVALVNSCAVTAKGERDARNALLRIRRENPGALLLITGCSARLVANYVPRRGAPVPKADLFVPQEHKERLAAADFAEALARAAASPEGEERTQALRAVLAAAPLLAERPFPTGAARHEGPEGRPWPRLAIRAYRRMRPVLKVQDGCSHRCTYCIVPLTRGRCTSRPPAEVIAEARTLLRDHLEIMVSGINLGQYGRDHREYGDFWDLLAALDAALAPEFAGRRRLRISSLEPSLLDERGIGVLHATRLVAPHLHISLQHASASVLRRMGRGHYSAGQLLEALDRMADFWPAPGLGADLLVGFPGETEADVDELCRFVERAGLTYAHVFPYSRRPGTPAASFPDQLPRPVKMERAARVRAAAAEGARKFWTSRLASPGLDLALDAQESHGMAGYLHGVDECYAPCFLPLPLASRALARADDGDCARQDGFLRVKPKGLCERGIVVTPLDGPADPPPDQGRQ